jgi:hypothetical protein
MNDVGEIRTRQGVCGVRFVRNPRDAKIGHLILPPWNGVPPPLQLHFRNGIPFRRQFD